jgi:acyl-CoA dehydrogenase
MTFVPPVASIMLALRAVNGLGVDTAVSLDDAEAIVSAAGQFAAQELAPLNRIGDMVGAQYSNGAVTTVPGWQRAYRNWCDGGWCSVSGPANYGGQDLPVVMSVACTELWNAANLAFAVGPLLTTGAIDAIASHASEELKSTYLPKMISGVWTGTMNLTEPQSGSDLSGLRCKAERASDGTYRISGTKIYITYGEHDCAENIIHLVLARLNDASSGTKGISLFLVPKILPNGARNDLRCSAIEHKMGMNGAPTCTMIYGDSGGATGWLVGEENRGLKCMFKMMNNARLLVGVQGVGLAERATQMAFAYARERKQGRAPGRTEGQSAIIEHPDVARMLVDMRAKTMAARLLCFATAKAIDEELFAESPDQRAMAQARAALLTPLAKAFSTDVAVEESGVPQMLRDARILPIYEGTNGIQAADLVLRKVQLDGGAALSHLLTDCDTLMSDVTDDLEHACVELRDSVSALRKDVVSLVCMDQSRVLAVSVPFLEALSAVVAASYIMRAATLSTDAAEQAVARIDAIAFVFGCVVGKVARYKASLHIPPYDLSGDYSSLHAM